ncbi:D-alanyl-D-alanine carboxypeptidase family protein [Roseibium alexandrii]|uniref:D-alanyl-D-alanine carboxypeptidase n=1 Tax=Roseibium alexandrii (strain DSM 17067 / NCIMB 14079 / DFL-11) TaxID=244592 RepID=A0A5E8GTG4_ROSAD|nr:D-alanyl-D-alanine carboxypeptidase family protein [Roseibium alexandrii]EEE43115.2 D-alanyl-D-alanine carboxypeptidase [Roseibium alexandrii DFL-11]
MLRFTAIITVLVGLLLGSFSGIGAGVAQENETLTTPSLVVDLDTGAVLHAEAAGHPWYPASTAKLMTALITFQALERGDVDLSTPVILSHNAMDQSAAYAGLKVGNAMTLEDALYAVLVGSANEVAVALAETVAGTEAAFVDLMNAQADRLGLTATHFTNPNGLFDQKQTVSARDLAVLGRDLFQVYPDYRRMFRTAAVTIDDKELISYNELITRYPGTLGLKTGFVCSAGRNIVAIAERDGKRLLAVVLGATTGRERSERTAKLFDDAFAGNLTANGQALAELPNASETQPEDMRMRLCSNETAAYEAGQNRRYPMGLPGAPSYLKDPVSAPTYSFQTWFVPQPEFVPVPSAKPVQAVELMTTPQASGAKFEIVPPSKPPLPRS